MTGGALITKDPSLVQRPELLKEKNGRQLVIIRAFLVAQPLHLKELLPAAGLPRNARISSRHEGISELRKGLRSLVHEERF